jgi:hypothetical protein
MNQGTTAARIEECKSCGKQIVFIATRKGSTMPIDATTYEIGDEYFDKEKHVSHFATCPNAAKHRRSR